MPAHREPAPKSIQSLHSIAGPDHRTHRKPILCLPSRRRHANEPNAADQAQSQERIATPSPPDYAFCSLQFNFCIPPPPTHDRNPNNLPPKELEKRHQNSYYPTSIANMNPICRRDFLKTGLATAGAAALSSIHSSRAWAASGHAMTIDLTPGAIGVQTRDPVALNALAATHGFTSVAPNVGALQAYSDSQLGELLAKMKEQGLRWGTAGCPISMRATPSEFQDGIKSLPQYAAALAKAGGKRVNTWIPPSNDSMTYVQNFRRLASHLKQIGAVLADYDLRLGLEYIGTHTLLIRGKYPFVHTMAETKDLIAESGADNIGFVLDSWHWWQAGDSADDIATLEANDIIAVDLNDAPKGVVKNAQRDNRRELPMATGVIDVGSFLTAIRDTGFDGPVRAEPFNAPLNALDDQDACTKTSAALKKAFALLG